MNNLRVLRNEKRLSQQALGEYFGMTQQDIYRYESGVNEPDIRMLKQFAEFFDTSIDYLVELTDIRDRIRPPLIPELNGLERKVIEQLRSLDDSVRESILVILDAVAKKDK